MVYFDCRDWSEAGYTEATVITRLNNMGDQYATFVTAFNAHNHDTDHYSKAASDAKFWNFTSEHGDYDKLDGYHGQEIKNMAILLNGIYMWGGEFAAIPANYSLCNGTNDTPNLVGSQLVAAGNVYAVGATGGSETVTPTGQVTIGEHALTINEMAIHNHSYVDSYAPVASGSYQGAFATHIPAYNVNFNTGNIGSGSAHGHSGSWITGTTYDKSGSFIKLAFIKKTS